MRSHTAVLLTLDAADRTAASTPACVALAGTTSAMSTCHTKSHSRTDVGTVGSQLQAQGADQVPEHTSTALHELNEAPILETAYGPDLLATQHII